MAHHKTASQPDSNDVQPGRERTHNQNAENSGGQRPDGGKAMANANKSKQGEDAHSVEGKGQKEVANERGGYGHSGHSSNRNGSQSNAS